MKYHRSLSRAWPAPNNAKAARLSSCGFLFATRMYRTAYACGCCVSICTSGSFSTYTSCWRSRRRRGACRSAVVVENCATLPSLIGSVSIWIRSLRVGFAAGAADTTPGTAGVATATCAGSRTAGRFGAITAGRVGSTTEGRLSLNIVGIAMYSLGLGYPSG